MADDVILNKVASIERCLQRIDETYQAEQFLNNYTVQDAVILNILRAIETTIDLGLYIIRIKHLGLPQKSSEIFAILAQANIIPIDLSERLMNMVGFRNIAVHEYAKLNLKIVIAIIEHHLQDLKLYCQHILRLNL